MIFLEKTKWITSFLAFCLVSVTCTFVATKSAEQKYIEVSNEFSLPINNYILLMKNADVDGDEKDDDIYVYGEKSNESAEYAEKINVAVVYKKNGFVKKTNISYLKGFVSEIEIADFTENKNKDILLKVFTDQDKTVLMGLVVDFGYEIPKIIFNKFSGISPNISFVDGYLVNVKLVDGQEFAVNLSAKKDTLIEKGFFDATGKCLNNTKIYTKPYFELSADGAGKNMLKGCQQAVTSVGEIELFKMYSSQEYVNGNWDITKIEIKY